MNRTYQNTNRNGWKLPTESVNSGSWVISQTKARVLEARVGTSVGVAVWDRNTGVGGLYHILLPKPTSLDTTWELEKYASTGMPHFIKSLYTSGAEKNNLRASIAGGALVSPISMKDLNLDIGGQITDIVMDNLQRERVSISKAETGGYFSCLLRLNMQKWDCSIKPIGYTRDPVDNTKLEVPSEEIDRSIGLVRPIPQIAIKVVRMIYSNNYNMRDIAREVKQDQVISAKILKICNSAYISPKSKTSSIDQALVILGEKKILRLVVSKSVELYYQDFEHGYSLCRGGLYHHALGTAFVAEKLAHFTGKVSPDVAYTAGLLHDIGKVVLDQYVAQAYPFFYRRMYTDEKSLVEVEREVMGVTHPEVGKRLAELWALPDSLNEVIAYHHTPEDSDEYSELTHLIYLSNLLMSRFQVGYELSRVETDKLAETFEALGIEPSRFNEVIDYIPWSKMSSSVFLSV